MPVIIMQPITTTATTNAPLPMVDSRTMLNSSPNPKHEEDNADLRPSRDIFRVPNIGNPTDRGADQKTRNDVAQQHRLLDELADDRRNCRGRHKKGQVDHELGNCNHAALPCA